MYIPEMEIKSIVFRTKGSNAILNSIDYNSEFNKENKKMAEKYEKENEFLNKYKKSDETKKTESNELPEDLKSMFDTIRQTMLTKNRNNWYISLLHFDIL